MNLTFRPHHFLCAYCYKGKGYSSEFTRNFSNIMAQLNAADGESVTIKIVSETDSICSPCPHKRNVLCESQAKILKLDQAHAAALSIQAGEEITWGEAKQRIEKYITLEKFHAICEPCEWKKLGICEGVLFQSDLPPSA